MHKAGFVNIVGNPNVGKSTLMNQLVGERISIATFKAQTTRHRIMGIVNTDDMQIVFSDTPGVLKPNYKMQEMMLLAGFSKVKTRVMMLTSSELPFPVLFNILLGYKASLLGDAVDLPKLFEDLSADVATGRRLVAAGVFIVSGERA